MHPIFLLFTYHCVRWILPVSLSFWNCRSFLCGKILNQTIHLHLKRKRFLSVCIKCVNYAAQILSVLTISSGTCWFLGQRLWLQLCHCFSLHFYYLFCCIQFPPVRDINFMNIGTSWWSLPVSLWDTLFCPLKFFLPLIQFDINIATPAFLLVAFVWVFPSLSCVAFLGVSNFM